VGIKGGNDAQGEVKGVGGEIMTSVGLPACISGSHCATWHFFSPSLGAMSPCGLEPNFSVLPYQHRTWNRR